MGYENQARWYAWVLVATALYLCVELSFASALLNAMAGHDNLSSIQHPASSTWSDGVE